MKLLDDSDESENEIERVDLKVNKKFADKFEKQERYKELQRSKELLKNGIVDDSEDSESESEDEEAEQLSTALDLKIIQTINSIRKKDPRIYDSTTTWFEKPTEDSEEDEEEGDKSSKHKKKYKDVLREQLLTHGADIEGENARHSKKVHESTSKNKLVYDQEQESLRQEFLKAAGGKDKKKSAKKQENSDDDDSSDDDVLTTKDKTPQQLQQEEIELKAALKEMKALGEKESKKRVISRSTAVMSSSLDPSEDPEEFLNNYLSSQKWKEKSGNAVSRKKKTSDSSSEEEDGALISEDDEELDKVDRFESKYNFRFEELQAEGSSASGAAVQVTGHARDVSGSLRRVDDKRKLQREQRQERKEKEKRKQEAELRRLKNLKRQELKERLAKIGEIAGLKKMGIDESLLDEDWDPKQHEAMMNAQFNDDYYGEDDNGFHYQDQEGAEGEEGDYTTQELLALEGYDDEAEGEAAEGEEYPEEDYGEEMNEEDAADVKHMVSELYQLDYEDIVAGIPCRFKYKEVEPEGFGLTAEEILQADDSELNKFVSLKHISAYNTKGYRKSDVDISKKRKKLRTSVKERLAKEAVEAEVMGRELKGTKKQPKKEVEEVVKEEPEEQNEEEEQEEGRDGAAAEGEGKKKRKRRKAKAGTSSEVRDENSSRGVAAAAAAAAAVKVESEPASDAKKAKTESVTTSVEAAPTAASSVVKVGTNKERKLKVLESKRKHRKMLVEQSKDKAVVKKAMKSTEPSISNASGGLKKRLDLYK